MLGLAVTMGVVSGVAINTAHEFGHKRLDYERWLSKVALSTTGYGHFFIEHNRGHHLQGGHPEDPASRGWVKASRLLPPHRDRQLPLCLGPGAHPPGSSAAPHVVGPQRHHQRLGHVRGGLRRPDRRLGIKVIPLLAIQAVFGFMLLEVVNYLEHYGLRRQREANGRYERCRPEHSWNSNNIASNLVLYHLQRHSDHHANPTRRFPGPAAVRRGPAASLGYGTMIVLAYFPPLWRAVMDRRVVRHYDGDLTRAALQPGKAEAILARYPAPQA